MKFTMRCKPLTLRKNDKIKDVCFLFFVLLRRLHFKMAIVVKRVKPPKFKTCSSMLKEIKK